MSITTETLFSENETANSKQIIILKRNFPQCFDKKGNFLPEKMAELMQASNVDIVKESYSLNWLGKSYARLLTNLPPRQLITADDTYNELEQNEKSRNVLIKGDNLEVLKHLTNAYRESVSMIYIDPPYNTGTDGFTYQDDFKFTSQQLVSLAGIDKEEAERILEFTEKGSSSHSSWLTFIYPRLSIARELLRDDGLIFISIDDNQQSQLKLLCDDIFGEENFVEQIVWKKRYGGGAKEKYLVSLHEYVLVYAKNIVNLDNFYIPLSDEQVKRYYTNEDEYFSTKGGYRTHPLEAMKSFDIRENLSFGIPSPDGDLVYPQRQWRWSKERADQALKNNEIEFKKNKEGNWVLSSKQYLKDETGEVRKTKPFSIIDDVYSQHGTNEILEAFGDAKIFSFPKPTKLIYKLVTTGLNFKTEGVILDFFAGSGSTADAVMQLNAEDNGNRQFICVQLDELTYKTDEKTGCLVPKSGAKEAFDAGYDSIFSITKARIEKARNKILSKDPNCQGDFGFKIYQTTDDFRNKAKDSLDLENPSFFDDVLLTNEQYKSLLTTWRLYDGSKLTDTVSDILLNGYTAHLCEKRLYLISPDFTVKNITALLEILDSDKDFSPNKIVIYGSNFDSANQMELNEALKSYGNKKSIDISLIVRY